MKYLLIAAKVLILNLHLGVRLCSVGRINVDAMLLLGVYLKVITDVEYSLKKGEIT